MMMDLFPDVSQTKMFPHIESVSSVEWDKRAPVIPLAAQDTLDRF
jgi:hypothetical protein